MAGAFQTSRDIFDNPIWLNIVEFRLFFLIYGKAAFTDGVKVGDIELKRGQWIRSYRNLRHDLEYVENHAVKQYSLSTIKHAVDNLVNQKRITTMHCELGTLFTVVNYDKYQCLDGYKLEHETAFERRPNRDRTETEQRPNNNKNANNAKKEKKYIHSDSVSGFTSDPDLVKAINDFIEMRNKIKKPMTERAIQLLFGKLQKLSTDTTIQIKILEQSILKNWQDVYPLKEDPKDKKSAIDEWVMQGD